MTGRRAPGQGKFDFLQFYQYQSPENKKLQAFYAEFFAVVGGHGLFQARDFVQYCSNMKPYCGLRSDRDSLFETSRISSVRFSVSRNSAIVVKVAVAGLVR